jgi:hypothetical protein
MILKMCRVMAIRLLLLTSSSGNNILDLRDVSLDKKLASQGYLLLVEDQSNGGCNLYW